MISFKMRVKEGQTAEQIQDYMFGLGRAWVYPKSGSYQYTDKLYFFSSWVDNDIMYAHELSFFEEHEYPEIDLPTLPKVQVERSPIGLRPKYIIDELRTQEILEAMLRYSKAGKTIPLTWMEELAELNKQGDAK